MPPLAAAEQERGWSNGSDVCEDHCQGGIRFWRCGFRHLPSKALPFLAHFRLHRRHDLIGAGLHLASDQNGQLLLEWAALLGGHVVGGLVFLREPGLASGGKVLAIRLLELGHPFANLGRPGFPLAQLPLIPLDLIAAADRAVPRRKGGEKRLHAVVVFLEDGIKLVIVTAGATDGQAQKRLRGRVGDVVQGFLPPLLQVDRVELIRVMPVEASRDQRIGIIGPELVPGQLLADEAIIRLVAVERPDDIIAVAPSGGPGVVGFEAIALGEACQIEPEQCPALAVLRRSEQPIDQLLIGVRRRVPDERVHVSRTWRQANQIEGKPTDELDAVRFRRRAQTGLFQLRENESINGIANPAIVPNGRQWRSDRRSKGPRLRVGFLPGLDGAGNEKEARESEGDLDLEPMSNLHADGLNPKNSFGNRRAFRARGILPDAKRKQGLLARVFRSLRQILAGALSLA